MSALPVYQVEFIPLERRLGDRRLVARSATLPREIMSDRRQGQGTTTGRRNDDRLFAALKIV